MNQDQLPFVNQILMMFTGGTFITLLVGMIHLGRVLEKVAQNSRDIDAIWDILRHKP
jgi:hypothetical protein